MAVKSQFSLWRDAISGLPQLHQHTD